MNYSSLNSMWDVAHAPSHFSQLPEGDFLALLHKQFSPTDTNDHSVSPQNPRQSPPSDDSSPSSPSNADAISRRQSIHVRTNDTEDASLKRKASSDDMQPGPSSKNQHTGFPGPLHSSPIDDTNSAKKPQPSRRKSSGNSLQDESRLLKRKEQNRAAQRAFRERKEKHVKDLEDKVAALEAKNEAKEAENTNLRDLLSRLQQENLALKQAQFTFSVPKPPIPAPTPNPTMQPSPFSFFGTPSSLPPPSVPAQTQSKPMAYGTDIDWNSLTTFDPSMLNVLDEPPDVPMQTDTTTSPFGQYALPQSYKTIANNPLLMSFVDESPLISSSTTPSTSSFDHFTFNFSSPQNSWTSATHSSPFPPSNAHGDFLHPSHSLDELFGGNFTGNQGPLDFNTLMDNASISPVQTEESPSSASESPSSGANAPAHRTGLSRSEVAKHIENEGLSPFADLANPSLHKTSDISTGDIIACQGSKFPRTKESPDNIEALKAWRCITQDPHFKDADVNELCAEFAKKARCDGTKVVLEPEGVHQLFEKFKKLQRQTSTQQLQPDHLGS